MAILIVQLSDIHVQSEKDGVFNRSTKLADAIVAEAGDSASDIVLLLTGDAVDKGQSDQFALAEKLIKGIQAHVESKCPTSKVRTLAIPGNHDLDLSGDQAARDSIVSTLTAVDTPAPSVAELALKPLAAYFHFTASLTGADDSLSMNRPYYHVVDLADSAGRILRFHLLNSAWMSKRKEQANSLTFPLNEIHSPESPEPHFAIAVLHHPFNWFRQPEAMRPLTNALEGLSDLILTGHEHSPAAFQKQLPGSTTHGYLQGGALNDAATPKISEFNLVRLDFDANSQTIITYSWVPEGYYKHSSSPVTQRLGTNIGRLDRTFVLTTTFEEFLDAPDLPLFHDRKTDLKLSDFYTYPDLRELDTGVGPKMWKRIKVDNIVGELLGSSHTLVTGSEKSGKSSLLKTLFRDLQRLAKAPLYLRAHDLRDAKSDNLIRKAISRAVRHQFKKVAPEQYEQIEQDRKVLLIDDWDKVSLQVKDKNLIIEYCARTFGTIIATATDDFDFEGATSATTVFKRFDICEFGHVRLQDLATKWLRIGANQDDDGDIPKEVDRLCKKIEQALRTNAIPHHPWILVVLLKQVDLFDQTAAKNGSYGHLYNAVITAALHGSKFTAVDMTTKYTYLANLANVFYTRNLTAISDDDMRSVHEDHCKLYDIRIDYSVLLDDLIAANMLRDDGGQIAFRAKYTYCFFLAKYLANSIHLPDSRKIVSDLSRQLFHDESANTIVFLAHLCSDPIVLNEMKTAASALFAGIAPIMFESDVEFLDTLSGSPAKFKLPEGEPAENLKQSLEVRDDRAAQRDSSEVDGRKLQTRPEQTDERLKIVHELVASRKTIQILGQVLRNEVGAIQGDDKLDIVKVIYHLSRRLLGGFLDVYKKAIPSLTSLLNALYKEDLTQQCKPDERERRAKDIQKEADDETRAFLWNTAIITTFLIVKHVSESVGLELLNTTFKRLLAEDSAIPNRIIDLAILFDHPRAIPKEKAIALDKEFRTRRFAQTLVRIIVVEHLYLYEVPMADKQAICAKLEIELPKRHFDPGTKLLGKK